MGFLGFFLLLPCQYLFYLQIATLALCILAGCYSHAGDIIVAIGEQEVTVDMLTELDRLVQLLESPIFTFVRMEVSSTVKLSQAGLPTVHYFSCWTATRSCCPPCTAS